jgi:hypothetical protein
MNLMTHYVDKALEGHRLVAWKAKKIGLKKIQEVSGVKPGVIKKFCIDPIPCKLSDIAKIKKAVDSLWVEEEKPELDEA